MTYSQLIIGGNKSVQVEINRYKRLPNEERLTFAIHNTTQQQTTFFIKIIIDSIGLSLFHPNSWGYTSIEVRTIKKDGRPAKGGTYLSFRGLSAVETKELLFKHLVSNLV